MGGMLIVIVVKFEIRALVVLILFGLCCWGLILTNYIVLCSKLCFLVCLVAEKMEENNGKMKRNYAYRVG